MLCLMSGGGSSLLAVPAPGISLADKQAVTRALLKSGAPISDINCVRKHLSSIKGGRLALAAAPASVVTLIVSDVPGDDPATVAFGPDRRRSHDARKTRSRSSPNIRSPFRIRSAIGSKTRAPKRPSPAIPGSSG